MESKTMLFPLPTRYILWVGIAACIIGAMINVQFYSGLGDGISAFFLGVEGLLLDASKIVAITLFAFLYAHKEQWRKQAYLCFVTWLILSCFSLLANYGFLSIMIERFESNRLAQSVEYQLNSEEVTRAQKRVDMSTSVIPVGTLNKRVTVLQEQLASEQATLSHCRPNYYTNCINPAKAKIKALQDSILAVETAVAKAIDHQAALTDLKIAKSNFTNNINVKAVHPLYENISNLTGVHPIIIKSITLLCLAITAELLSGLMLYLYFFILADVFATKINDCSIIDKTPPSLPQNTYAKIAQAPPPLALTNDDNSQEVFSIVTKQLIAKKIPLTVEGVENWLDKHNFNATNIDVSIWFSHWVSLGILRESLRENGRKRYHLLIKGHSQ